jgi:hypothetical protein
MAVIGIIVVIIAAAAAVIIIPDKNRLAEY